MGIDRQTATQLKRFATAFSDARQRGANESDTVMYLVKFFEEVLGYDSLKGEISKELAIRDRYCDIAIKIDGEVKYLVEAKAAGKERLHEKHIEQAENYASRQGICWVVLTNGVEWQLYHLTFNQGEGIQHSLAWTVNLLEGIETDVDALWATVGLLHRQAVRKDALEEYWNHKKALAPSAVVRVLFDESVLKVIRRELNRDAPALLELEDVFRAVRDVLSKEALADAGDLGVQKKRKRRKRIASTDPKSGQVSADDLDAPDDGTESSGSASTSGPSIEGPAPSS